MFSILAGRPWRYTLPVSDPTKKELHGKVLQSLHSATAYCDAIPDLPHLRRPPARTPARALFSDFNDGSDSEIFDTVVDGFPWGLPSDELIRMAWDGWCISNSMSFAAIQLDHDTSLYFEFNDSEADQLHFLALSAGVSPDLAHDAFLTELFRSNGQTFNTGLFGSPPSEVTSRFPCSTLAEKFLVGADRAVEYGCNDFWEEVLQTIMRSSRPSTGIDVDISTQFGRRKAIEAYLKVVLHGRAPR